MNRWQKLLIAYFGINLITAVCSLFLLEKLIQGVSWINKIILFLIMLVIGTPVTIYGLIEFLRDTIC